jgi:hypothetical protein
MTSDAFQALSPPTLSWTHDSRLPAPLDVITRTWSPVMPQAWVDVLTEYVQMPGNGGDR